MNQIYSLFLQIVSDALHGNHTTIPSDLSINDFQTLLELAHQHKLLALVIDYLSHDERSNRYSDVFKKYKALALEEIERQYVQEGEFLNLMEDMQKNSLNPIVMKGIVCRQLYPSPLLRPSVDEDLLIPIQQLHTYHDYLENCGIHADTQDIDFEHASEVSYHKPKSPTYLELHTILFPEDADAYSDINKIFPSLFSHTSSIIVDDVTITTLEPTYHFLYLITHAFKHFLYSGFGIRQVCDIALFAYKYYDDIDWDYCQSSLQKINAYDFTIAILKISKFYLDIDDENADEIHNWLKQDIDEKPLLMDILEGGLYGIADENRLHSSNITLDAVAANKTNRKHTNGILKSLFPSYTYMKRRYPIINKRPYLLPGGWFVRIIQYLLMTRKTSLKASNSIKIAQKRIALFQHYHVIKKDNENL